MITRAEVIRRAQTLWAPGTVPYSQAAIHPGTGYRQDCSGFVSMCWGIPANASPGGWGGLNTVTLVTGGWMREIPPADLQPGDAVGVCGPGTGGDNGHVVIFEKWLNQDPNDDHYWLFEQAGGQRGPEHRVVNYPYDANTPGWKAYRFRDITDGPAPPAPTPGGNPMPNQYDGIKDVVLMNGPPGGTRLGDVWGRTLGNAESAKVAAQAAENGVRQLLDRDPAPLELDDADIVAISEQVVEALAPRLADIVAAELARLRLTVDPAS